MTRWWADQFFALANGPSRSDGSHRWPTSLTRNRGQVAHERCPNTLSLAIICHEESHLDLLWLNDDVATAAAACTSANFHLQLGPRA
jgi:hypothetical protein